MDVGILTEKSAASSVGRNAMRTKARQVSDTPSWVFFFVQ